MRGTQRKERRGRGRVPSSSQKKKNERGESLGNSPPARREYRRRLDAATPQPLPPHDVTGPASPNLEADHALLEPAQDPPPPAALPFQIRQVQHHGGGVDLAGEETGEVFEQRTVAP